MEVRQRDRGRHMDKETIDGHEMIENHDHIE